MSETTANGCEVTPGDEAARELPTYLGIEQVSDGWIKKYVLSFRLPDGRDISYDVVSRKPLDEYRAALEAGEACKARADAAPDAFAPASSDDALRIDAVCIVGHTAADEFLLIREFRFPMNRTCVAFPAGLKDSGETVLECASRELREETGYDFVRDASGEPVFARTCTQPGYSSLGMGDESIAMVFAEVERTCEPQRESTEFIEVFPLPRADIERFLEENRAPLSIRCQLVLEMVARPPFVPLQQSQAQQAASMAKVPTGEEA